MPLGVTASTEEIYAGFLSEDRRRTFFHGHSYTANPLACAVALASLDLLVENDCLARVARLEALFRSRLEPLRSWPQIADVRILGDVAAIELKTGDGGYLDGMGPKLAAAFIDRGLLLRPLGNVVYFMPPYAILDEEAHWAIDQIEAVLSEAYKTAQQPTAT
jgi:adenosylmethionine-8-amino-7-oxononanoate aminotransferase